MQKPDNRYPRTPPRLSRIFQRFPLYFVTCCTRDRRHLLANEKVHSAFVDFAEHAHDHGIAVGKYVILPDHLHLFVVGGDDFVLGKWIGTLKRILAKHVHSEVSPAGMWQRGFFDHVVRSSESYSEKWTYVRENPVRAGLVSLADEWPFAGEIVAQSATATL
jgi:putative transposase